MQEGEGFVRESSGLGVSFKMKKKTGQGVEREKKVPKQKLRSGLRKGKKIR